MRATLHGARLKEFKQVALLRTIAGKAHVLELEIAPDDRANVADGLVPESLFTDKFCSVRGCNKLTDLKKCERCAGLFPHYYCSVEHQKSQWKGHKTVCMALLSTTQAFTTEGAVGGDHLAEAGSEIDSAGDGGTKAETLPTTASPPSSTSACEGVERVTVTTLSDQLIHFIFAAVVDSESVVALRNIKLVCKRWLKVADGDSLWRFVRFSNALWSVAYNHFDADFLQFQIFSVLVDFCHPVQFATHNTKKHYHHHRQNETVGTTKPAPFLGPPPSYGSWQSEQGRSLSQKWSLPGQAADLPRGIE
jgi:hypothetical protein